MGQLASAAETLCGVGADALPWIPWGGYTHTRAAKSATLGRLTKANVARNVVFARAPCVPGALRGGWARYIITTDGSDIYHITRLFLSLTAFLRV